MPKYYVLAPVIVFGALPIIYLMIMHILNFRPKSVSQLSDKDNQYHLTKTMPSFEPSEERNTSSEAIFYSRDSSKQLLDMTDSTELKIFKAKSSEQSSFDDILESYNVPNIRKTFRKRISRQISC